VFNDHGIKIISAILEEVQSIILEMTRDLEQLLLPLEALAIKAAQEVFALKEHTKPLDIMNIIETCLKDVRKDKSKKAMKSLSLLISVTKYVKLCTYYKMCKACKLSPLLACDSSQLELKLINWVRCRR